MNRARVERLAKDLAEAPNPRVKTRDWEKDDFNPMAGVPGVTRVAGKPCSAALGGNLPTDEWGNIIEDCDD